MSRRFNQSAELARASGRNHGQPLPAANAVRRKKSTGQQIGVGEKAQREANMRGAFEVTTQRARTELFGKRIVLVDDVYTTGATVSAVTRVQ